MFKLLKRVTPQEKQTYQSLREDIADALEYVIKRFWEDNICLPYPQGLVNALTAQ